MLLKGWQEWWQLSTKVFFLIYWQILRTNPEVDVRHSADITTSSHPLVEIVYTVFSRTVQLESFNFSNPNNKLEITHESKNNDIRLS